MWKTFAVAACAAIISLNSIVLAATTDSMPPEPTQVAAMLQYTQGAVFPVGTYNARNTTHFTGDSYVASLTDGRVPVANVTFVNGAHTYWHMHHHTSQTLLSVSRKECYQIEGQALQVLLPGHSVTIPAGVRHWHGAESGHMFQHIAVMEPVQEAWTEWFEPVDNHLFCSLS